MTQFATQPVSEDWERLMHEYRGKKELSELLDIDVKQSKFVPRANAKLKKLPPEAIEGTHSEHKIMRTDSHCKFRPWETLTEELLCDKHFFYFVLRAARSRIYSNNYGFTDDEIVAALTTRPLEVVIDFCDSWYKYQTHKGVGIRSWTFHLSRHRQEISRDAAEVIADQPRTWREHIDAPERPGTAAGYAGTEFDPTAKLVGKLNPEEEAIANETKRRALEILTEEERRVIELLLERYSPKEIATELSMTLNKVYRLIASAKKKFGDQL